MGAYIRSLGLCISCDVRCVDFIFFSNLAKDGNIQLAQSTSIDGLTLNNQNSLIGHAAGCKSQE